MYVEVFRINPAGEYADYLTDSTTFRMYIGIFDPEENGYTFTCKDDSIIVSKYDRPRQEYDQPKLLSRKVYSLGELKQENPIH
jgi:hypothetical protein